MSLVTTKEMLNDARDRHYAVGAFNVENMEMVQAVLAAAERLRAPVIMQTTPSAIKYAGADYFYGNVFAAAKDACVPVALHLDHGSDYSLAVQAVRAGYTSIMIDGSKMPLESNIQITRKVTELCSSIDFLNRFPGIGRGPERERGWAAAVEYRWRRNLEKWAARRMIWKQGREKLIQIPGRRNTS